MPTRAASRHSSPLRMHSANQAPKVQRALAGKNAPCPLHHSTCVVAEPLPPLLTQAKCLLRRRSLFVSGRTSRNPRVCAGSLFGTVCCSCAECFTASARAVAARVVLSSWPGHMRGKRCSRPERWANLLSSERLNGVDWRGSRDLWAALGLPTWAPRRSPHSQFAGITCCTALHGAEIEEGGECERTSGSRDARARRGERLSAECG